MALEHTRGSDRTTRPRPIRAGWCRRRSDSRWPVPARRLPGLCYRDRAARR
jgi:hypothetical protein